ncbi:MAG: DNA repair protein RadC [Anaerolineae bacterium]|nr:DNA repair protein RadC [Anaerolineae bacterium]
MSTYQTSFVEQSVSSPKVRDLPERERPVTRLREVGPQAVSNVELVACLLQSSDALHQAQAVMAQFQDLRGLSRATEVDLTAIEGIGPAQAARVKAALEIGRRLMAETPEERWQIRAPSDAAHILMPMLSHQIQEHLIVMVLDTRNRVIHQQTLYVGTRNTSLCRIAEVFGVAMQHNAAGIMIAHNHPSGDPNPSPEDVALTRRLVEAGKLMEIAVLDHLVIGHNTYVSLHERNLGFEST